MNILEKILQEGEHKLSEEHKSDPGVLHAGNTGIVTNDGDVLGECARITLARYLGYDEPKNDYSKFYFQGGHANEWNVFNLAKKGWKGTILNEEEVPTAWSVRGVTVGGRPDGVFYSSSGNKEFGVELKCVCSAYRAKLVEARKPDSSHLCQAAHYSWQLKIPFIILYSSYSSYYSIKPGRVSFYCDWDDHGYFYFINPDTKKKVSTVITSDGIVRYYNLVLLQKEMKELAPMFCTISTGPKGGSVETIQPVYEGGEDFPKCRTCAFRPACSKFKEYDTWIDAVKTIVDGGDV